MSHSPARPSMDRPRFVTRILITPFARGLSILGPVLVALSFALLSASASAQTISCGSGFSTSGACGAANAWPTPTVPFVIAGNGGANVSGSTLILQPAGVGHNPNNVNYQTPVSTTGFTTTFTFTPNAWNLAFYLQNVTRNGGYGPQPPFTISQSFTSGAGCEGGFYQSFGSAAPPNNIFVINFDSANDLVTTSPTPFYSHVQLYGQLQSPCIPSTGGGWWIPTNKVSTSPVPMNSPATTAVTTTGDTYNATIMYTGSTVTLQFYDVTAGGSCPGARCFTYSWPNVSIPAMVDGTTALLGFSGSTNANSTSPLNLYSLTYSSLSAAATPTFSPPAGTYGSTQSVTISDTTGSSYICYNTTGGPATNGIGGCSNGTLYTGAISVPKGATLYAVAGVSSATADSAIGSASYNITGSASTPTFNQPGGTWQGNQTVQLTAAHGGVICYNTTGSPATNGSTGCTTGTLYSTPIVVSSNETIYAVAGGTGFTDSSVGSAAYVISPFAVESGFTGSFPANSPTMSPVPGTYTGTQSVTLASTTSGANICYILTAALPTLMPEPDSLGGCTTGTLYSSPVPVSSSQTLYAAAGTTVGNAVSGTGPPSSIVHGSYTISPSGGLPSPAPPTLLGAQVH